LKEGKHCGTFQKQNTFIPACLTEAKIGVNRQSQFNQGNRICGLAAFQKWRIVLPQGRTLCSPGALMSVNPWGGWTSWWSRCPL